jgi:hypothetical protein
LRSLRLLSARLLHRRVRLRLDVSQGFLLSREANRDSGYHMMAFSDKSELSWLSADLQAPE